MGNPNMTALSDHFTVEEFTDSQTAARKGINNVPSTSSREWRNLHRVASVMEDVRLLLGSKPILISSGYRSPAVNTAVGGSKSSAHMSGLAADFTCPGFGSPLAICKELEPHMKALGIDQLIHEFNTWVHLGLRNDEPRHQALTINNNGTRTGFV
jgi:zinc D-Ala-D-Ala carboxypeptidase